MSRPRHTPGIAASPARSVATSPCALPGASGATSNPALWGTLLQRLYDGAATPIEQTSEITGSPMTVVNDRANTGDRRELRTGRVGRLDGTADYYEAASNITGDAAVSTLSVCVEFDVASPPSTTPDTLLAEWTTATANRRWLIQLEPTTGYLQVLLSSDGTNIDKEYEVQTSVCDGARHTAGFTLAGGVLTVFVDGAEATVVKTTDNACASLHANAVAHFGSAINLDGTPANILSGDLHSAVLTSDVMTEAEFLAFHTSHTTPDNQVALYWFEAGSGAVEFDASGNGNTLTVNGTTADVHQADTGVTFSAANSLGHSYGAYNGGGASANGWFFQNLGTRNSTFRWVGRVTLGSVANDNNICVVFISGNYTGVFIWNGRITYRVLADVTSYQGPVAVVGQTYVIDVTETPSGATFIVDGVEYFAGSIAPGDLGGEPIVFGGREPNGYTLNGILHSFDAYNSGDATTLTLSIRPEGKGDPTAWVDSISGDTVYLTEIGSGAAAPTTVIVPRDESDPTKDVTGATLQYSGSAPRYAQVIQSGALQGDGVADYVSIPDSLGDALEGSSTASMVLWAKYISGSSLPLAAFLGTNNNRFGLFVYGGSLTAAAEDGIGGYGTASLPTENAMTCFVLVYDGTATGDANRLKLFVNGVEQSMTFPEAIPASLSSNIASSRLMSDVSSPLYATSLMSVCGFYSDALTPAEVLAIYESGTYPSDNLEALYPCSEVNTAEGTVYDVSGNERHGTINGTVADVRAGRQDVIAWNQLHGFSLDGSTYVPGFNGLQPDGVTATTYAPGATADKFTPDASQVDRTGGVSHPDANVNSWDTSFESGDTQTNPEFVRDAAAGDDRFLAYQDTLTGDDLTSAQDYTT